MENFVLPEGTDTLKESREMLNNALLTVRSLSCGTAFPVSNLTKGMLCYRTDQEKLYQYTASGTWSDVIALQANSAVYDSAGTKLEANTYVNLSGTQTITGTKTFKASPIVENPVLAPSTSGMMWFNGTISRIVGSITAENYTGNANTATSASKLTTPIKINGVSFDGSTDITVDSGVMSINGKKPNENGNIILDEVNVGVKVWD